MNTTEVVSNYQNFEQYGKYLHSQKGKRIRYVYDFINNKCNAHIFLRYKNKKGFLLI
jgi:hypothetical protein